MDARETLKLISKQWCNLDDLMKLAEIGKNNAVKLRREIKDDLINKGYTLPNNRLPMIEVVNKLKININYLEKMAKEGGEEGKRVMNRWTKIITIILALVEAIGIYLSYRKSGIFINERYFATVLRAMCIPSARRRMESFSSLKGLFLFSFSMSFLIAISTCLLDMESAVSSLTLRLRKNLKGNTPQAHIKYLLLNARLTVEICKLV